VLEEAARTIGDAAQATGATLDAPEDTERLMGACEAIVAARARLESLRVTRTRPRDLMGPTPSSAVGPRASSSRRSADSPNRARLK